MTRSRPVRTPDSATVVVDPAGRGDCTTIAEALLLVPATGGHIYLAKGTHALAAKVTILSRGNITIEGTRGSIVDVTAIGAAHGFELSSATDVTMRGFQMLRTGSLGGYGFIGFVGTNSGHRFIDLTFTATAHAGLYADANGVTTDILVHGCSFRCGSSGVFIGALGVAVNRLRIEGCDFGAATGVVLNGQASGIIGDVAVVGNSFLSCTYGVQVTDYVDNLTVDGNSFLSCTYGIYITSDANNSTITGNTFKSGTTGVYLGASTVRNATISGNTFVSQGGVSILNTGLYTTIAGNTFNTSLGGITANGAYATITGNTFIALSATAIYVQGASNTITGNLIYNLSAGRGIEVNGVADTAIVGNTISTTFSYGIYPHGGVRTVITGNKVSSAGSHGIYVVSCDGSTVEDNLVYASAAGGVGIYLWASPNSTISGNLCASNTGVGILVDASALVQVEGNTCLSNTGPGISLTNADNCDIVANLCSANSTYGISEDAASTGNNYSANRLTTNTTARFLISAGKLLYQDGTGSIKASGTTANAYVTVFTLAASNAGLSGCFRIFNTDAVNTLTYQITFTGMDTSSQVQSADIAPLSNAIFDGHTDQGTALAPFKQIVAEVKSKVGGAHATYTVYAALAGAEV